MDIAWSADERAEEYVGENSGIDVGEYDGTVAINLNTGVGVLDGDEAIIIGGVGYSSIWGGGEKYDVMLGYSGDDKEGSTEFFFVTGDGRDTISNFGFMTGDNADTADKINFLDSTIRNVMIDGEDVLINVGDEDYL